jgi:hypothetical protein
MSTFRPSRALAAAAACTLVACLCAAAPSFAGDRAAVQYTQLISANMAGGVPNGPSGNSVISGDKRYARVIAYESDATDLVPGDTNGQRDVFAVHRGGTFGGDGHRWTPGPTVLISRTATGEPANGPSFAPSVDGAFQDAETKAPSCVAFLSAASNIVPGDGNGTVDAFLAPATGGRPKAISPGTGAATTAVAVSGDCSYIAMIVGEDLYVYDGKVTRRIETDGPASDPSFSVGRNQDLVFATPTGVWRLLESKSSARLVARGGANPSYNDVKRQVVAYEKPSGGYRQVMFREVGEREHVASGRSGVFGDGDSRKPLIGNSGYSIAFETDAANLGVNALSRQGDDNGATDVYLFTDVRNLTLLQSVAEKAVPLPGGGRNPGMNFYNNYITFDSPAPLGSAGPGAGPSQVYMRYLGGVSAGTRIDDLPAPQIGETASVVPRGTVLVRLPAGTSPKRAKALGLRGAATSFVKLSGAQQLPMGSTFDTAKGTLGLYTSGGFGKPQNHGQFKGGRFTIGQSRKNPLTTLSMSGGGLNRCGTRVPRGGAAKPQTEVVAAARRRRVFGNARGRFRTRGRNSSATVRGTQWSMTDTCRGTLTSVRQGRVVVRDFRLGKRRVLRRGQRYLARPLGRRRRR